MIAALKARGFEYIADVDLWRKLRRHNRVTYIDEWARAELKALFEAVTA